MSDPRLAVVTPGRTSSGGSAFSGSLVPALEKYLGNSVVQAWIPPAGRFAPAPELLDCTDVVFLGTRAQRVGSANIIFWPLNVAPFEKHVVRAEASSIRNRLRHGLLSQRLGRSVAAADGLVFGSYHARTLYQAAFPVGVRKPYSVIMGGTPSGLEILPRTDPDQPLLLLVSHLYPYKGILEFVEAVALALPKLDPATQVRVAGADRDPRYAAAVRRRIEKLDLVDRVTVKPADPVEMAQLYARAKIAVFMSSCENAGSFALYDGLHAGVPTICSDRSSMPEMVTGAVQFVNPYDAADVATAICELVDDPAEQQRLADAARLWSASAPTWEWRAQRLLDFIGHRVRS